MFSGFHYRMVTTCGPMLLLIAAVVGPAESAAEPTAKVDFPHAIVPLLVTSIAWSVILGYYYNFSVHGSVIYTGELAVLLALLHPANRHMQPTAATPNTRIVVIAYKQSTGRGRS